MNEYGSDYLVGVDEVGYGAFAGPVASAAVSYDMTRGLPAEVIITDSKKMSPEQREKASEWIKDNALVSIGTSSAAVINDSGIMLALQETYRQAVSGIEYNPKMKYHILIDGKNEIVDCKEKQTAIIGGDQKVPVISMASIVAKVYRDNLMARLHQKYPMFGWEQNKGYGTKAHREALLMHGPCEHHRKLYVRKYIE